MRIMKNDQLHLDESSATYQAQQCEDQRSGKDRPDQVTKDDQERVQDEVVEVSEKT